MQPHNHAVHTALVILNYNGYGFLEKFLPSVILHSPATTSIVVGDNASTDNSVSYLKKNYPQIKIIELDKNYGFAEGYNQTLNQVQADYYFLLNSDVELTADWQVMVDYMQEHIEVAAMQPKIVSFHKKDYFEHAGASGGWIDGLAYPFCRGRILDNIEKDENQYDSISEIFWASGAAMLVRAELFHKIGGFDGDFFAHMEEIDWCWRAKKCGWKIIAYPLVKVNHVGGGTLPYTSARKVFLNFRNNIAMLLKNQSLGKLFYLLPMRFVLDSAAAIQFLFKNQAKSSLAVIKAYLQIFSWFPALVRKRKIIHTISKGREMNAQGIFNGSILVSYFIKGHKKFKSIIAN